MVRCGVRKVRGFGLVLGIVFFLFFSLILCVWFLLFCSVRGPFPLLSPRNACSAGFPSSYPFFRPFLLSLLCFFSHFRRSVFPSIWQSVYADSSLLSSFFFLDQRVPTGAHPCDAKKSGHPIAWIYDPMHVISYPGPRPWLAAAGSSDVGPTPPIVFCHYCDQWTDSFAATLLHELALVAADMDCTTCTAYLGGFGHVG